MRFAAASYPLSVLDNWSAFEDKIAAWVADAAGQGAELLVFPEYAAMELATLDGLDAAGDLEASLFAVAGRLDAADRVLASLAGQYGVHILAGSGPAAGPDRPVNRARLITPFGRKAMQDKQIMTPWERDPWNVAPGGPLAAFETDLGRIGVLICYDAEFPLLARALGDLDVLLVPSCTETLAGYWRVRIGAMARALELQCVSVMASLVGAAPWSEAVDVSTGAGGIFCPPDQGMPDDAIVALGQIDVPGWTIASVDMTALAQLRKTGATRNRTDWSAQQLRLTDVQFCDLRTDDGL